MGALRLGDIVASYAARLRGADSFEGGIRTDGTSDLVSEVRLQFGQVNKCAIVIGSWLRRVERIQRISTWQFGHSGGSNWSSDRFSLSTMTRITLLIPPD